MSDKLNGSVQRLGEAMRDVFVGAVDRAVDPLHAEMKAMEGRLNERIDGVKG